MMRIYFVFFLFLLCGPAAGQQVEPQRRPVPDCAAPATIQPRQPEVSYAEFHELRAYVEQIGHALRSGKYTGQPGPVGPQGPKGDPGESAVPYLQPIGERLSRAEYWLTSLEAKFDEIEKQIEDSRKPPPRNESTGSSAPAQRPEQGQTSWIEDVLRPVAAVVGNAYAGPVGGAIATSVLGGFMWLLGRKKKAR